MNQKERKKSKYLMNSSNNSSALSNNEKDKIVIIVGSTAIGKSKLSIELAKTFKTDIISVDSIQIYNCLDM